MTNMPKYYGLCETCEHDATCSLRRDPQLNIIECEEFSIQPVHSATLLKRDVTPYSDPSETSGMGLCSNCLYMDTCGFPNALQNVLQCEEYELDRSNSVPLMPAERRESAA